MIIRLINFPDHIAFTLNIEEGYINPHINDATKYDLLPKLGKELVDDLTEVAIESASWTAWNDADNFLTGDTVTHNTQVWEASANNSNSIPSESNNDWILKELKTFWYANIKPYMVFNSAARYMVYAGKNFSQYGITKPFDPSSQPASGSEVGAMIKDCERKQSVEHNLLMKVLFEAKWKFDNDQYTEPTDVVPRSKTKNFGINAI